MRKTNTNMVLGVAAVMAVVCSFVVACAFFFEKKAKKEGE